MRFRDGRETERGGRRVPVSLGGMFGDMQSGYCAAKPRSRFSPERSGGEINSGEGYRHPPYRSAPSLSVGNPRSNDPGGGRGVDAVGTLKVSDRSTNLGGDL